MDFKGGGFPESGRRGQAGAKSLGLQLAEAPLSKSIQVSEPTIEFCHVWIMKGRVGFQWVAGKSFRSD